MIGYVVIPNRWSWVTKDGTIPKTCSHGAVVDVGRYVKRRHLRCDVVGSSVSPSASEPSQPTSSSSPLSSPSSQPLSTQEEQTSPRLDAIEDGEVKGGRELDEELEQETSYFESNYSKGSPKTRYYSMHPVGDNGMPLMRVLVIGEGPGVLSLCEKLKGSGYFTGVYCCAGGGAKGLGTNLPEGEESLPIATQVPVPASDAAAVIEFTLWASIDLVLVEPSWTLSDDETLERGLAERNVTFFGADEVKALIQGAMDFDRCMQSCIESLRERMMRTEPEVFHSR